MYKKVMLTLDGSLLARAAVRHVAALVSGTDAEVIILQVTPPIETIRHEAEGMYEMTDGEAGRIESLASQWHSEHIDRAKAEVGWAEGELNAAGVKGVSTEVTQGFAGNVIVDTAARAGCDAIVMACRGHGGLGREVMGSVAEYVLRHAGSMAVVLVGSRA